MGCVSVTVFAKVITFGFIAITATLQAYHRRLCELYLFADVITVELLR
jgi:hypothetical protein